MLHLIIIHPQEGLVKLCFFINNLKAPPQKQPASDDTVFKQKADLKEFRVKLLVTSS